MNKDQFLGQVRAALTAAGAVLATWGINDGNDWAPITGIVVTFISLSWGWLHHRDPATSTTFKWSLFRKLINVAGSALITYGLLNPEKVQGVEVLIAALGPLLASWFSWIDNSPANPTDDDTRPPDGLWLILAAILFIMPSCAEFPINAQIQTPYGDITTDSKGGLLIAPRADVIRFPIRHEK